MKESNTTDVSESETKMQLVKTEKGKTIEAEKNTANSKKTDPKLIEQKKNELAQKREEHDKRHYVIGADLKIIKKIHDFINTKAKWNYTECFGIVEIDRMLNEQIIKVESEQQKNVFINAVALEAIHYFMKKYENIGLDSAKEYLSMFEPLAEALQRAQKEYETLQNLEFELASLEHGIDVENLDSNKIEQ